MSNAVVTTGILLKRATVEAPTVFTTVAELVSITPPGFSRNPLDTSNHNEGVETKVLGLLRQKDTPFKINWLPENPTHDTLLSDILGNVKAHWQVAFPSGTTMEADAFVQRFEPDEAPVDAVQSAMCALSWSSAIEIETV
jgi:hypothetical protein